MRNRDNEARGSDLGHTNGSVLDVMRRTGGQFNKKKGHESSQPYLSQNGFDKNLRNEYASENPYDKQRNSIIS